MGKYKKGNRVIVNTGVLQKGSNGIIRDIRTHSDGNGGKRVVVKYIVEKMTSDWDPTEKFVSVTKEHLKKVTEPNNPTTEGKPRVEYHVVSAKEGKTGDGLNVTVVGMVETVKGGLKFRRLRIGYSIQHPDDKDDPRLGVMVAKRRCVTRPMSVFLSPNPCEFRERTTDLICRDKLTYILDNIKSVIAGRKEGKE